jgi:CheY-like chemotaxis protein/nitrogen-specific signal transduction histidine kinase/HPt (histidine-containing phosphotransfer) domain-containing protein
MLGTNWDITEHKESEITLQKAKEAAEELAHSKSEFLANMSHEIRTPMNAIIGLSNLALNKEMSDQVRDYLFKINSSSESLLGILNDILDFSKIEAGKLGIESRSFNLANMLDDLSDLFLAQALGKNLGFTIKMDAVVPKLLVGDSLRIQQILSNLLGNAIKFTPQGKVGIQVQLLEQENSNAKLLFSVSDTGIGISAEDQARLFQPFSQADTSITRRFGGTGLGLAISHRLLQLMGSNIVIDSEPGLGTTFSFELLLGVAAGEVSKKIERRHVERKAGTLSADLRQRGEALSGRHILVAEDSVINQQVVKEFLKLSGVNVDIANNGKEALSRLEQKNYDAILMDIHMPEMGGVEATENIRRQAKYANLPIIALTAGVTQEERANCRDCGMNDFVAKPINPEELISVLCHWIGTQEIPSTLAPEHPAPSVLSMSTQEQTIPAGQAKLSLTGFDFTNLLEMVGGDEGMIKELLLGFREEMDSIQSDIEARIQENKLHEAGKLFHRVKGTAGNLGAMGLSEISATLETSLKRNVLDSRDYDKFKNLFQQTKSVLGMLG